MVSRMIYRTAPFQRPGTTHSPDFKVTPLFEYLRNGTRYIVPTLY